MNLRKDFAYVLVENVEVLVLGRPSKDLLRGLEVGEVNNLVPILLGVQRTDFVPGCRLHIPLKLCNTPGQGGESLARIVGP